MVSSLLSRDSNSLARLVLSVATLTTDTAGGGGGKIYTYFLLSWTHLRISCHWLPLCWARRRPMRWPPAACKAHTPDHAKNASWKYTVKKVSGSLDVTYQTLPGRELLNYSQPGRLWLVTSRLGTRKTMTFFTVLEVFTNNYEIWK